MDVVPAKKPQPKKPATKGKAKKEEVEVEEEDDPIEEVENTNGADADDDEDDDDEEGEEYVVETILNHAFEEDGVCKYEVKWLGYESAADRTWEPEVNL